MNMGMTMKHALNIVVTSIDEVKDTEYDSDYGTTYNDKYSMVNQQCSPSVPSPLGDINELYKVQSHQHHNRLTQRRSQSANQLKPSLLFGRLDQLSNSDTYQSNTDSIHSIMDGDGDGDPANGRLMSDQTQNDRTNT